MAESTPTEVKATAAKTAAKTVKIEYHGPAGAIDLAKIVGSKALLVATHNDEEYPLTKARENAGVKTAMQTSIEVVEGSPEYEQILTLPEHTFGIVE